MMQGRRFDIPDDRWPEAQLWDYGKMTTDEDGWFWYCVVPGQDGQDRLGSLIKHTVTEHEDGTITASPSILVDGWWHGYLEQGIFREV